MPRNPIYCHDPDGNTIEFVDLHSVGDGDAPADERGQRRPKSHLA